MNESPIDLPLGPVTLAVDHVKAMRACLGGEVSAVQLGRIKKQLSGAGNVSVLTDPEHGLQAVRETLGANQRLVVSIEDGDHARPEVPPRKLDGWDAGRIAEAGADLIKCFFWYQPGPDGLRARQFLAEVARECEANEIPLMAEPMLIPSQNGDHSSGRHGELLLQMVRELSDSGAAALKLEFAGGAQGSTESGAEVSAAITEVSSVPWYLLSQGVSFEVFHRQLVVAIAGGASGCVVGRAVWRDLITTNGLNNRAGQILRDRLSVLQDIVEGQTDQSLRLGEVQ